jgi:hypothetical protein
MGINNFTEYKKRIQMKLPCNFDAKVGFAENARVILPTKSLSIRKGLWHHVLYKKTHNIWKIDTRISNGYKQIIKIVKNARNLDIKIEFEEK